MLSYSSSFSFFSCTIIPFRNRSISVSKFSLSSPKLRSGGRFLILVKVAKLYFVLKCGKFLNSLQLFSEFAISEQLNINFIISSVTVILTLFNSESLLLYFGSRAPIFGSSVAVISVFCMRLFSIS
uniref:Uncharacterized protein n=1 Tax=Cryptosporidium parvum TaxID=5807 RepID=F0X5F3_CRYPV